MTNCVCLQKAKHPSNAITVVIIWFHFVYESIEELTSWSRYNSFVAIFFFVFFQVKKKVVNATLKQHQIIGYGQMSFYIFSTKQQNFVFLTAKEKRTVNAARQSSAQNEIWKKDCFGSFANKNLSFCGIKCREYLHLTQVSTKIICVCK